MIKDPLRERFVQWFFFYQYGKGAYDRSLCQ